ncbi:MAG: helicase, superfamily, partial [Bacteroidota bacterium]|nr:helicase, superfamily [Bacteroidota bacterium]
FLTYASTRYKFGNLNYSDPSRFLQEIPENILSYHGDLKRAKAPEIAKTIHYAKATSPSMPKPIAKPTENGEPFIADDASTLQVGMEVVHEKFGDGKVVSIEGRNIAGRDDTRIASIFFSQFGVKKIMLKFARLKILSGGI